MMTDDELDPLIARLRQSGPTQGVGVDFDTVARQAGRRHQRRRAVRAVGAGVVTVAALAVGAQTLGGPGGSATTSAGMPAGPARLESTPGSLAAADATRESAAGPPTAPSAPVPVASAGGLGPGTVDQARTTLGCPTSVTPAAAGALRVPVPEPPSVALLAALPQLHEQLLAGDEALSGTVCRYDEAAAPTSQAQPQPAPVALSVQRRVDQGLQALTQDLAALPPGDPGVGVCARTGPTSHLLLRVDYPLGPVWVSARADAGSCAGATNGVARTDRPVGAALARLAQTGVWAGL